MLDHQEDVRIEDFYNNYLQNSYNKARSDWDENRRYKDYLIKNFRKFLPKDKNSYILDIGIGDGATLSAIRDLGYKNYYGIDIAEDLINAAKMRGLACEHVDEANSFLKLNKNKYSVISIFHVIEHISKQEVVSFLKNVRESLCDGGVLLIVTPSVQNIFYLGPFWDFTHVNFFTERSLYQVCEAACFEEVNLFPEKDPINTYGDGFVNYFRFLVSDMIIRCIRVLVNSFVRCLRFGLGMINPRVLSPNLVCVCKK